MIDSMPFVYVDFNDIKFDHGRYLTDLTWIIEDPWNDTTSSHHYFIDYPGAKDSERSLIFLLGENRNPLVRYSMPVVLLAFVDAIELNTIVVCKDRTSRDRLLTYLSLCSIPWTKDIYFRDDVLTNGEKSDIIQKIEEAKLEAAQRFGNSL